MNNIDVARRDYAGQDPVGRGKASSYKVPLHVPTWEPNGPEVQAALDVLNSRQVTCGEKVRQFEQKFGDNAVMVNSGSSANLLAVATLCNKETDNPLRPGDQVIVPALCWATTVWPLVQYGLVPVIVDIDPETLNIDLNEIERAFESKNGTRTPRAIMPVAVYGNPVFLQETAWEKECYLINDCCEALSQDYHPRADFNTFSFYFSHHITTLEGGMVQAATEKHAELLRVLRAHGWLRDTKGAITSINGWDDQPMDPRFTFVNTGYNLRPTELQAAIGLVQWQKLGTFVEKRRAAAKMLSETFGKYGNLIAIQREASIDKSLWWPKSSWFGFPIIVRESAPFAVSDMRDHFEEHGVETRSIICGNIARQPAGYARYEVGDLRHADHVMRNGFSIGCHQGMGEEQCAYVAEVLDKFFA